MELTLDIDAEKIWATVYAPNEGANNGCAIVYYHGGGFLYGQRRDLPEPYLEMIARAGYTLVALDYPLAPERTLEQSLELSLAGLARLVTDELDKLGCDRYALFGRSAGAFLALKLARLMQTRHPELAQPQAIWSFYGYWDLTQPFVSEPSAHYAKMPDVGDETVRGLVGAPGELVLEGPKATRFSLYVYARQQGAWGRMLGVTADNAAELGLREEELSCLPPTFIAASTGDQDVPLRQSKTLMRAVRVKRMRQVYYLEHDFDRDITDPTGAQAYEEALTFLREVLGASGAGNSPGEGPRAR